MGKKMSGTNTYFHDTKCFSFYEVSPENLEAFKKRHARVIKNGRFRVVPAELAISSGKAGWHSLYTAWSKPYGGG